jgi:teichuronic acid biosynthesis glycosyltransferase TuaG
MEKYMMCTRPFFSIIITVYNGESTIEDTVNSIFKQTFKNFELLIYNDGSIDNTDLIINKLLANYSFKYESFPKTGRVALLNEAIKNSKADYICICDCDDVWHPRKLEFQNNFLESNPTAFFVCTKMDFFIDNVNFEDHNNFSVKIIPNYLFYLYNPISHSSIAFKKGIAIYANFTQHDYNLYFDLIGRNVNIYQINKILTFNRIHSNQNFQSGGIKYYNQTLELLKIKIVSSGKYYFFIFYVIKLFYYYLFSSLRRRIIMKSKFN